VFTAQESGRPQTTSDCITRTASLLYTHSRHRMCFRSQNRRRPSRLDAAHFETKVAHLFMRLLVKQVAELCRQPIGGGDDGPSHKCSADVSVEKLSPNGDDRPMPPVWHFAQSSRAAEHCGGVRFDCPVSDAIEADLR
jgi:hypothetical protein